MQNKFINNFTNISESHVLLQREQVEKLIISAIQKPVTTIVAGVGFGKTRSVSTALEKCGYTSVWVQISEADNFESRFWERFSFAFRHLNGNLSDSFLSLSFPDTPVSFFRFISLLEKEIVLKKRLVLVIDDFYLIKNKNIIEFFEKLIFSNVYNLSIVLISRKKPELNLSPLLSKDSLTRITEDDLRFSREEVEEYFKLHGIFLENDKLNSIYLCTEGWIFAVYLVLQVIKKQKFEVKNPVPLIKEDIFDLIKSEVYDKISKNLKDLLIYFSFFDTIPANLLKEIVNYNETLLNEISQLNFFVCYDSFSENYRVHHLFKEFLSEKKSMVSDEKKMEIYRTAAIWYEKNDNKIEAIRNYRECEDYDKIFDIILSFSEHVTKNTADLFIEYIDSASKELLEKRPQMLAVKAKYFFNNNRIEEAERLLDFIKSKYEKGSGQEENKDILGEAYVISALINIVNQNDRFIEDFKKANELLPNGSSLFNEKFNIAEGLNVCSIKSPAKGELKKHDEDIKKAAVYASKVMNGCGYGLELLNAAESSFYVGDLKTAEKTAFEAVYQSRQRNQLDVEFMANFVLVRVFMAKGYYEKIKKIMTEMEHATESLQSLNCISIYDIIKGWFFVKIGKTENVPQWIKQEEEKDKLLAPIILGREYLVKSDCMLAEKRFYELLAFMVYSDKIYEKRGILFATVQNKITKAIIFQSIGEQKAAAETLNEAYNLTCGNNLIMQYIEYGNRMRALINAVKNDENCKIPKEWLEKIGTKSSSYAKQVAQVAAEFSGGNKPAVHLSKREFEVLRHLYIGMKRDEISTSCNISISTVNSTIKNIYNKLGAQNVADAIRIAKDLKLF